MPKLAVTYYVAPYPSNEFWDADLAKIKKSGFDAIQVIMPWGWIEPKKDQFQFDDFDQLFSKAEEAGLNVIPILKPEFQPRWVWSAFRDARLTKNNTLHLEEISTPRGLFPGCDPDSPDVWERMSGFLQKVVKRYADRPNLEAWVAYQLMETYPLITDPSIMRGYQKWLQDEFQNINELNKRWRRRYLDFEDILPTGTENEGSPEYLSFLRYHNVRMVRHTKARIYMIRSADPSHKVVVYGNKPFMRVLEEQDLTTRPFPAGNDWALAEAGDISACACFPKWGQRTDSQRDVRLRFQSSAIAEKPFWLGEFHRAKDANISPAACTLDPALYQRWLWQGIAMGAQNVSFFRWKDEITGPAAGYFGFDGNDGKADERLEALAASINVYKNNRELLDACKPVKPKVAVLFSPSSYNLYHTRNQAEHYWRGFYDYCLALSQLGISYKIVEETKTESLNDVSVLFIPRLAILPSELEFALNQLLAAGSTIFAEAECGAYSADGSLVQNRDRWISRRSHILEKSPRSCTNRTESILLNGAPFLLNHGNLIFPLESKEGNILHTLDSEGESYPLLISQKVESGMLYAFGGHLGGNGNSPGVDPASYTPRGLPDLFMAILKQSNFTDYEKIVFPQRKANGHVSVQAAESNGKKLFFVFSDGDYNEVGLRVPEGTFTAGAKELLTNSQVAVRTRNEGVKGQDLRIPLSKWGVAVLVAD